VHPFTFKRPLLFVKCWFFCGTRSLWSSVIHCLNTIITAWLIYFFPDCIHKLASWTLRLQLSIYNWQSSLNPQRTRPVSRKTHFRKFFSICVYIDLSCKIWVEQVEQCFTTFAQIGLPHSSREYVLKRYRRTTETFPRKRAFFRGDRICSTRVILFVSWVRYT
jgi:hypothetical protein